LSEINISEEIKERAILVGLNTDKEKLKETEESLNELARLAETAEAEVAGIITQNRQSIKTSTYIGEGKAIEIKEACIKLDVNLVIFDNELTGSQVRNLEEIIDVKVIDRSMLILEIFAKRAVTKEGKVQVELAQLRYRLPRLIGMGKALSRLGAGIGTRGPGETQLETDRRHILERIRYLEKELKRIKKHRELIREGRRKKGMPIVALVGYTNAGKSTLLNALTGADVFVEDKLFATLDTSIRIINVMDKYDILFVDTVGFIRKLPHHLVESFKSTLEEIKDADLILHVVDSNSEELDKHKAVVNSILADLEVASKPIIMVYNKIDNKLKFSEDKPSDDTVYISAKKGIGIIELVEKVVKYLDKTKKRIKVIIPFEKSNMIPKIYEKCEVINEEYNEVGRKMEILVDGDFYRTLREYVINGGEEIN
jgi:GTP-binding protein HflX